MKEIALRSDFDFACGHPCSSNNDNNDSEPVPLEEFLEAEKDRSLGHYDPVSGFIITAPRYSIFPTISMEEEQSDSTLAHLAVIRPDPFVAGLWAVMGDGSVRNATERRAVRRAVFQELKQLGSLSSSKSQLLGFSEDNLASQVQYPDAFQYSASNAHQDNDMFGQVPPQRPQMDLYDMVMRQYQNDLLAEQQLQQKAKKSKRAQRPLRLRRKRLYRKKNKKQVETVQSENDMEPVESMRYATISSINISTLDAAPIPLVTPRTTFYQRVRAIFQRKSPKVHPA